MGVPDANQFRRGECLKRSYGFSTRARSGTCCHRAIRTTKPYIGAFRLGAVTRFFGIF